MPKRLGSKIKKIGNFTPIKTSNSASVHLPSVEEILIKHNIDPVSTLLKIVKGKKIPLKKKIDILLSLMPYYHPKPKMELDWFDRRKPSHVEECLDKLSANDLIKLLKESESETQPR